MTCKSVLIASLALAMIAMIACQRQAPAPVAVPAITAKEPAEPVTPEAATETTMAQAGVQPTQIGLDTKAFAGTFTGTLPCADCPGIEETLVLDADGHFELNDVYSERPAGTQTLQGAWSSEANGKRIRLDPGSKSDRDRVFAIDGYDRLTELDSEGQTIGRDPDHVLKRSR